MEFSKSARNTGCLVIALDGQRVILPVDHLDGCDAKALGVQDGIGDNERALVIRRLRILSE